jgi:hypothetical protein
MGTKSFPAVKRPGRDSDHPATSSIEVKERIELYNYSPSGPSWPVLGRISFTFTTYSFETAYNSPPERFAIVDLVKFVARTLTDVALYEVKRFLM